MDGDDILVIDDIRTFRFPATYARTRAEAWLLLFSRPWREVWFDYDLGLTIDADNSYELAVEMERRAYEGVPIEVGRIVVHTANPYGGERLMAALSRWYDTIRVAAVDYLAPGSSHNSWRHEE